MGVDITGDSEHPHFVGQRAGSQLVDKTCRYPVVGLVSAQRRSTISDACMAGLRGARLPNTGWVLLNIEQGVKSCSMASV